MRIESQIQSFDSITSSTKLKEFEPTMDTPMNFEETLNSEDTLYVSNEKLQQAVNSVNEIFEINNKQLQFVYHEGLEQYFVQLINSETKEVVKEIPPKKLLDAFYEMQKLVGMIIDEKR